MKENNQREIELLKEDPGAYIVSCQPLIKIIVRFFVKSKYLASSEHDEVISYINEKLLRKINKIREQYNGISLLRTYMSSVIRNLVLEKIREARSGLVEEPSSTLEYSAYSPASQLNSIVIKQELQRLSFVLATFDSDRHRLEFSLKVMYKIPVTHEEFLNLAPETVHQPMSFLWGSFSLETIVRERDHFKRLANLFTTIDRVDRSSDCVRKWVYHRLHQVIELMNGEPKRANYDLETIQLLIERYYSSDVQFNTMNHQRGQYHANQQ